MSINEIKNVIKQDILIGRLELEGVTVNDIIDDAPLFGDGLGLDSVEALDIVAGIKTTFGIDLTGMAPEDLRSHFFSVQTLAAFVENRLAENATSEPVLA
jgi:acyl carrier protein